MSTSNYAINDPVHGVMQLNSDEASAIKAIIDTPSFQRLRRIKQLGLGHLIYPGAVHTRFNHMLGTGFITKKIIEQLVQCSDDFKTIEEKGPNFKLTAIITGLLHDVGHGPYSHAFEKVNFLHKDKRINEDTVFIDHESWNRPIIDKIIKELKVDNKDENAKTLFDSIELSGNILAKKHVSNKKNNAEIISKLISSQLDADRMDYLLRDSHFCGVDYGAFSIEWLIHCIDYKSGKLGITKKGLGTLEHYLLARRLMQQYVYYHPKKIIAEYLFKQLIQKIYDSLDDFKDEIRIFSLLKFLNKIKSRCAPYERNELSLKKGEIVQSCVNEFCAIDDSSVDEFIAYLIGQKPKIENDITQLARMLHDRILPIYCFIYPSRAEQAQEIIEQDKSRDKDKYNWRIHYDFNDIATYSSSKGEPIFIIEKNILQTLDTCSPVLNALTNKRECIPLLFLENSIREDQQVQDMLKELIHNECIAQHYKKLLKG